MKNKKCTKCQQVKALTEYGKHKHCKDGLDTQCKECKSKVANKWNKSNRGKAGTNWKRWRSGNKGLLNKYYKDRKEDDAIFHLTLNTRSLISNSFRRAKVDEVKSKKTEELLGCTMEYFVSYIESKLTDGMTLDNYGEWHLDHITPLATAKTVEDVERLNHYTNFQPLWAFDNISKGAKIIK